MSHPPHRAHESPLTFLRSRTRRSSLHAEFSAPETPGFRDFLRESVACLHNAYGAKLRRAIYQESEMETHENLDTLAVRRLQTWFSWQSSEISCARPAIKPETRKSYVLKLRDDSASLALISHVFDQIAVAVPFLADPNNCWACVPAEISILLSSHLSKHDEDLALARRVCIRSSPMELRLVNLVWRRNGTLWAQWRVERGNIDRLRSDLRIVSGASILGTFNKKTSEDPTRSAPFVVESLLMAVLHKPSSSDFRLARTLTDKLAAQLRETPFVARRVYRLRTEMCTIDRTGHCDVLPLMKDFPKLDSDVKQLLWGIQILKASPSVRRILATCGLSLGAIFWLSKKLEKPSFPKLL